MAEGLDADIQKFTEQLAKDPASRAFVPLSDAYRKMGRYDEAIAVAQEGLKHQPHYVGGKVALARAHFENGDLEPARALLEDVLHFAPDNLMANRILAEICVRLNDKPKAISLLQRLLAVDSQDHRAAEQLASLKSAPAATPKLEPKPEPKIEPPAPEITRPRPAPAATKTATLAELYRSQGHLEKALEVYRDLGLRDKVTELERMLAGRAQAPAGNPRETMLRALLAKVQERRRTL